MLNPTILLVSFFFFRYNKKNNGIIDVLFLSLLLSVSVCFLFSSSSSFIAFSLAQQSPSPTYQSTDLIFTSCPPSPLNNYIFENDANLILKFDDVNLVNCPNLIFRNIINVSQIVVRKSSVVKNSSLQIENVTCSTQSDIAVGAPFCISFEDSVSWSNSPTIMIKNVHREGLVVVDGNNISSQNPGIVGGVVYFSNLSYFSHIETLHVENIRLRHLHFVNNSNNNISWCQQSCNFAVVVLGFMMNISKIEITEVFLGDGGWAPHNYYDPEYYPLGSLPVIISSPMNSISTSNHSPCSFFVVSLPMPIVEVRTLRINRIAAQNMLLEQNTNEMGDASSNRFMQIGAVQLGTPASDGLDNDFNESSYASVEISQIHLQNISLHVNSTSYRIGGIKSDAVLIGAGINNMDNITIADVTFMNVSVNYTQQDSVVVVSGVRFAPQVNITYLRGSGYYNDRILSVQRVLVENVMLNIQFYAVSNDIIISVRGLHFEPASFVRNYNQTMAFNLIQVSEIIQFNSKFSSSGVPKQIDISGVTVDGMFEGARSLLVSNILVSSITGATASASLSVKSCSFRMEIPSNGLIGRSTFVELAQMENISVSSLRNLTSFGGKLIVVAIGFEGETSFLGSSSSASSSLSSFVVKNVSMSGIYDSRGSSTFPLWILGVWFERTVAEFGKFSSLMSFRDFSIKDCVNSGSTDGKVLVSAFYAESASPFFGNDGNNNNNQNLYSSSKFEVSNILVSNWKERSDENGNANTIRFMAVFLQSGVANFTEMYFGDFVIEGLHLIDASSNTADNVLRVGSLIFGRFDFVIGDAGSKNALLLGQNDNNNNNNNNNASLTISNITHSSIFLKTENFKQKIVFNAVAVDAQVLNFTLVNVSGVIVKDPVLFDATAYTAGVDTSEYYVVRFAQNVTAAPSSGIFRQFLVSNCGFVSSSSENADFPILANNNNSQNQGIIFATGDNAATFVVVGFSNDTKNNVFLSGFSSVVISDIFFSANSYPSSFDIASRKSSLRFYAGVPSVSSFVFISVYLVEIKFNLIGNNNINSGKEADFYNLRIHNVTLLGPIFSYEDSVILQINLVIWRCPSVRRFDGIEMSNILAQNVASEITPDYLFFSSVQIGNQYSTPPCPSVLFDTSSNSRPSSFKLSNCSTINVDFRSRQPFIFNLYVATSTTIKNFDEVVFENLFIGGWKSVNDDDDDVNNHSNPEFSFGISPPTFRLVSVDSSIQLSNFIWNDGLIIANVNSTTKNPTTIIFRNFLIRNLDLLDSSGQIVVYGVSLSSKTVGAPVVQNFDHVLIERIRMLNLGTITSTSTFNYLAPCSISKASVMGSGKSITTSESSSSSSTSSSSNSSFGSTFIIRNVKLARVALIVSSQSVAMFPLQLISGQFRYFQAISISNISLSDVQQARGICTLYAVYFNGIAIIGQVQTSSSTSSPLTISNISTERIFALMEKNGGTGPVIAAMFAGAGTYSYFTSIAFVNFLLSNISATTRFRADVYALCFENNYKINNIGINNDNTLSNFIKFSGICIENAIVNVSASDAAATIGALYFGSSTIPVKSPALFEISHVKMNQVRVTALFSAQIISVVVESVAIVMASSSLSVTSMFRIDDVEMSDIFVNITSPAVGAAVGGIEFFQSVSSGEAVSNFSVVVVNNIKIHNSIEITSVGSSSNSVAGLILANILGKSSASSSFSQFFASNILVSDVSMNATGDGPSFIQGVYATYSEVNLSRYNYLDSYELSNISLQNIWIRSSSYIEVTSINSQVIELAGNTPIIILNNNNNMNVVAITYKNISIREISTETVGAGEKTTIGVVTGNGGLFISAPIMKFDGIVVENIAVNATNKSMTKSCDIFICLLTASRMKKSLSFTNILVNASFAASSHMNQTKINNEGEIFVIKIKKVYNSGNTSVRGNSSLLQILISRVRFIDDSSSCSFSSPQNCSILGLGSGLLLRANVDFRENSIEGSAAPSFVVLGGASSLASRNTGYPDSSFIFEGNSAVSFTSSNVNNQQQQQPSLVFVPSISTLSSTFTNTNSTAPFFEMNSSQWILRCNNWPRRLDREFKGLVESKNPEAGQQVHLDCVSLSNSSSMSEHTRTSSSSATIGSSSHSKSASPANSLSPSQTFGTETKSVSEDDSASKTVTLLSSPTLSYGETKTRTHQLPPPPYVPPYRHIYQALATASSFLQLTAAASAASAIRNRGVLSSLTRIMTQSCGIDEDASREMIFGTRPDVASSPTQMYFGFGNGGWLAGTVVGNCVLLIGIALVQVGGYSVFFSAEKSQEKSQDPNDQEIGKGKEKRKIDSKKSKKKKKIRKPNWPQLFIQSKTHHTLAAVGTMLLDPTLLATCYLLTVVGVEVDVFWKVGCSLLGFGGLLLVGFLFVTAKYVLFRKPIERFVISKKASVWDVDEDEETGDEEEENDEDSFREKLLDKSGIRRIFDYFMSEEGEWKCPKKGQLIILQSDDDDEYFDSHYHDDGIEMSQVRNKKSNNTKQTQMPRKNRDLRLTTKNRKSVRSHHIADFELASPLIEPYTNRFRQFFTVDLVVVICITVAEIVGVITGSCLAQGIILIVVIGIFAVLILVYRPLQERFLRVAVPFISIVQCVVLGFALYLSSDSEMETSGLDTIAILALVLSALQFVVAIVSVFPPLLAILDILVIKWKLRKISQRAEQERKDGDSVLIIENPIKSNQKKLKKRRRVVRRKLQEKTITTSPALTNLNDLDSEMTKNDNSTPLLLLASTNTNIEGESRNKNKNENSAKKAKKRIKATPQKDGTNEEIPVDDFSL